MKRKVCLIITIVMLLTVLPQLAWAASALKVGDSGWKVKVAQQKLNVLGIKTATTGKFSSATEKALREFQTQYRLQVDGKLSDATYHKLMDEAFNKEGIKGVKGVNIVQTAAKYKGVPYKFGGTTPQGFDCSGFVCYVFKQQKATLPRLADAQALLGKFVLQRELQVGDLVFFTTSEPGASHVGIYAGKHKFWHASSSKGIMLSDLSDTYWKPRYYGARRILANPLS
ncbi:MAG: NlpC/P60 family protein [Acidaminococcaceae bacterium]